MSSGHSTNIGKSLRLNIIANVPIIDELYSIKINSHLIIVEQFFFVGKYIHRSAETNNEKCHFSLPIILHVRFCLFLCLHKHFFYFLRMQTVEV